MSKTVLNDIEKIRKTKEYFRALENFRIVNEKTGEVTFDNENLKLWENTIVNSPYRYYDDNGRQKAVLPDPKYIISITDSEGLKDKIKRLERGERIGINVRPGSYDLVEKVLGYDVNGKPVYTRLRPEIEDLIKTNRKLGKTLSELTEEALDAKALAVKDKTLRETKKQQEKASKEAKKLEEANKASEKTAPEDGAAEGAGE